MEIEDKKYVWWGLLGIGVAAFFYFLSSRNNKNTSTNVQVPYLVPATTSNSASPSAGPSLSNQPNIIGSSPNSVIPNGTNPANTFEAPNVWPTTPVLNVSSIDGPFNNVQYGSWLTPTGMIPTAIPRAIGPAHA